MAPSVAVDTTPDLPPSSSAPHPSAAPQRTLLLAPPSISAHPEALSQILSSHDRQHTDIQMLDRLALNLAALPTSTYDAVLLLTDADGSRAESRPLLTRAVMGKIAGALRPGGRLRSQDGAFGGDAAAAERTEAILAGLVQARDGAGMEKPDYGEQAQAVPLRLGRGRKANAAAGGVTVEGAAVGARGGKRKGGADDEPATPAAAARPAGVGFVDFSDDFGVPMVTGEEGGDDDDDDELIDEDALLTEADLARPIVQRKSLDPPPCPFKPPAPQQTAPPNPPAVRTPHPKKESPR